MKNVNFNSVFFVGIGGIGMSALALYMLSKNINVYGYDKVSSRITKDLERKGALIIYRDDPIQIHRQFLKEGNNKTSVVYTPAIPKDQKLLSFFRDGTYDLFKRSDMLQLILKNFRTIAVAGTHGKTTTSSILAHVLNENIGCNAFLGGIANNFGSNFVLNDNSDIAVVEADEFDRSFLKLDPFISVITSVEADHLDVYGQAETFVQVFQEFSERTFSKGLIIKNSSVPLKEKKGYSYANYNVEKGDNQVSNFRFRDHRSMFDMNLNGTLITDIHFQLPGIYNAMNALGASIAAKYLGVSGRNIKKALESFRGIDRRFEFHIQNDDLVYIDDYAHHPSELDACIGAVRSLYPGKKIAGIFQPHLFSRTKDFMDGFAKSLSSLDELFLMEIYPAREAPIEDVTSAVLLDKTNMEHKQLVSKSDLIQKVGESDFDVLLTLGAGDIDRIVDPLKEHLFSKLEFNREHNEKGA